MQSCLRGWLDGGRRLSRSAARRGILSCGNVVPYRKPAHLKPADPDCSPARGLHKAFASCRGSSRPPSHRATASFQAFLKVLPSCASTPSRPYHRAKQKIPGSYGSYQALRGLTMEIDKGELFGFVGPNGAGKTTTMKIIAGLMRADSGEVVVAGRTLSGNTGQVREIIG